MSLNKRSKRLLNLKRFISMKRFLNLKPSRFRSKTEKSTKNLDCLKATANLAAVETVEHDTEAVSHITRDVTSIECNSAKKITKVKLQIKDI